MAVSLHILSHAVDTTFSLPLAYIMMMQVSYRAVQTSAMLMPCKCPQAILDDQRAFQTSESTSSFPALCALS